MALCYLKLKEYKMCIQHSTAALQINPKLEKALYRRGYSYIFEGEYEKADEDLRAAYNLSPQDQNIHNAFEVLSSKKKEYENKLKAMMKGQFDSKPKHTSNAKPSVLLSTKLKFLSLLCYVVCLIKLPNLVISKTSNCVKKVRYEYDKSIHS
jgi:tetratricopeptide (TPR) repeat protein